MDTFMEKMVTKRKTLKDNLLTAGIILAAMLLIMISLSIQVLQQLGLGILFAAGFAYLGFRLISSRNVEFEYIVTNGDLDIDKIISRRKRKRILSASCKEFDLIAKVSSEHFNQSVQSIKNRIDASSSIHSPGVYFTTLNYKGQKTLVIFEPDERMLNNFRIFIPRKIFIN